MVDAGSRGNRALDNVIESGHAWPRLCQRGHWHTGHSAQGRGHADADRQRRDHHNDHGCDDYEREVGHHTGGDDDCRRDYGSRDHDGCDYGGATDNCEDDSGQDDGGANNFRRDHGRLHNSDDVGRNHDHHDAPRLSDARHAASGHADRLADRLAYCLTNRLADCQPFADAGAALRSEYSRRSADDAGQWLAD